MLVSWKKGVAAAAVAACVLVLLSLLCSVPVSGSDPAAAGGFRTGTRSASAPTVSAVSPALAPNNLDTTLVITGSGFGRVLSGTVVLTEPSVLLDGFALSLVRWVSTTSLTATVPWGLDAGVYTVTVTNPGGGAGSLSNAFTVTQAINVWTTGGPYGGQVTRLVGHPTIGKTIYAIAGEVGLFRSTNGGDSWQHVHASGDPLGAVALKPGSPETILYGEAAGLHRSLDGGNAWQTILSWGVRAVAYAPSTPDRVYISSDTMVWRSDDDGQHWLERSEGLQGGRITALAVHAFTDTTVYAGTEDGRIYKTTDGGAAWQETGADLPDEGARDLVIDPFKPLRVYAAGSPNVFHRTLDGGQTWKPMSLGAASNPGDVAASSLVSGTLYAAGDHAVYGSIDAGATWVEIGTVQDMLWSLELDPETALPRYAGGSASGVFRSRDGGVTWEQAAEGMNALRPVALAASPLAPQQVYATAAHAGGYASSNAGRSWQEAVTYGAMAATADPTRRCVAYMDSGSAVFKTTDCGLTWDPSWLPTEPSLLELVLALAVDPHNPDTIYAGVRAGPSYDPSAYEFGKVYSSTNGGASWHRVNLTFPISVVSDIAFDPLVTGTIYLATGPGEGKTNTDQAGRVYKSIDGGVSWKPSDSGLYGLPVAALVVDPSDSSVLYVGIYQRDAATGGGVYKSKNGGQSWFPVNSGLNPSHDVIALAIDPAQPQRVYAGIWGGGLYRTENGGVSWTRASGPLGFASIWCLAAESTEDRTFLYVGTSGGGSGSLPLVGATIRAEEMIGGGVYQQTIVHRPPGTRIYLPLVLR
jgi:photosystem II stability/assembly factor-like uncharacterized protein